jgi:hypothetical protein
MLRGILILLLIVFYAINALLTYIWLMMVGDSSSAEAGTHNLMFFLVMSGCMGMSAYFLGGKNEVVSLLPAVVAFPVALGLSFGLWWLASAIKNLAA